MRTKRSATTRPGDRRHTRGAVAVIGLLAVALAACGSSPSAAPPKTTITKAIASMTATRSAQFSVTASSGALTTAPSGVVADPIELMRGLSVVVEASALSASDTLASKNATSAVSISVDYRQHSLVELRIIPPKSAYFYLTTSSWAALPLRLSASDKQLLSEAEAFLGNRWYSLPESLLQTGAAKAGAAEPTSGPTQLWATLEKTATLSESSANGGTVTIATGSLSSLVNDLLPVLNKAAASVGEASLIPKQLGPLASGTYTVRFDTATATATLTRLAVDATNLGQLSVNIAHAPIVVVTPTGATPLPQAVLGQLGTTL